MEEFTELTGELSQVEQYCPDWAKEIMAVILKMPRVQNTFTAEDMIYYLKKESTVEQEKGIFVCLGRQMFWSQVLRKLQINAINQLSKMRRKNEHLK